jgi:hypothetical protein
LPVAPLPQVDFPTISVNAQLPGASPMTVATSVASRTRWTHHHAPEGQARVCDDKPALRSLLKLGGLCMVSPSRKV